MLSVVVNVVGLSPGQYFYFQEVFPVLAAKHCIMQANAEYHQSIVAKQQKKFGEEIGRLQVGNFFFFSEKYEKTLNPEKLAQSSRIQMAQNDMHLKSVEHVYHMNQIISSCKDESSLWSFYKDVF